MKRILQYVLGIGLIVGLGYLALSPHTETYEQTEPQNIEVEPEPTPEELMEQATQKLIAVAIAASSTEIETAKEEAAKQVENELKLKIEKRVREDMAQKNDTRIIQIEKETKLY